MTYLYYIFLIVAGMMLKFVDDLIDNPKHKYSNYIFLKIVSMFCLLLIYIYLFTVELNVIPLALLTTLHGIYADNVFDCKNIDSGFWILCSLIVIIFAIFYFMYSSEDFYNIYFTKSSFLFIMLFGVLAIIEMIIFTKEVSIEKITFRSLVVLILTLFVLISKMSRMYIFDKIYYKVLIVLTGYAMMSVIDMTILQDEKITNETN